MSTQNRDTHRDKLLAAARELLREREYGAITARDLVAASNTNLGSIGYHFGSKDGLLYAAIGDALEEWSQATIDACAHVASAGPDTLVTAVQHILDNHEAVRPYYQAFIAALARSAQSADLKIQLAEHYNRQRARVADTITELFNLDHDNARGIASLVVALVDGLMIQSYVDKADAPTSSELPALVAYMATTIAGADSSPR